jgi:hypothetical protein
MFVANEMRMTKCKRLLEQVHGPLASKWLRCAAATALCGCAAIAADRETWAVPIDSFSTAFVGASDHRSKVGIMLEPDGRTKVLVREKYHDGRRFLEAFSAALMANRSASSALDVDLDVQVAKLAGFNGEALRDVVLRLAVKGGEILEFTLAGKFGDADLRGELRTQADGGRTIQITTDSAGALFRFINIYRRVQKGRELIVIGAPSRDIAVRRGTIVIHDFSIIGEPDYKPFAALMATSTRRAPNILKLSRLRFDFTLASDQIELRDGVAYGPLIGAAIDGKINLAQDDVQLRGMVIPLLAWNWPANQFLPLELEPTLAEGFFGFGYHISGPTGSRVLRVDPAVPFAPGILRKLFAPATDEP